jgi:2-oxo-4-hydroxy-4-carboxy-5-ureidoimidazoline decarboxylase
LAGDASAAGFTLTLGELNRADRAAFVAALGGVFEHSPWVAEKACDSRPFARVTDLHAAMVDAMMHADATRQLALIRAHPELAGKAAVRGELTAASSAEQASAGLTACSPEEYAKLHSLNARYNAKFGFPFILAVRGYDRQGIIAAFERRVERSVDDERAENLRQIARIAALRLQALIAE